MKNIQDIIKDLNKENGSNYKLGVLKDNSDNPLLEKVLQMTYDRVRFVFGITLLNITYTPESTRNNQYDLEYALNDLRDNFCTRKYTGTKAQDELRMMLSSLSKGDAVVLEGVINRDLRINTGRTMINKVFKNLITKPPYMRCNLYNEKTQKKITFPAFVQIKCDGSYCTCTVESNNVTFNSRSGEEKDLPHLKEQFKNFKDGVYIGELLVKGILNRSLANGVLNSDDPKDDVYIQLWDFVSLEEYSRGKDKKNKTWYKERLKDLSDNITISDTVQLVETFMVQDIQEALKYTSRWMNQGLEGSILKDKNNIFVDHTSPTQLKLKLEIDLEVRITGFTEGKKGTKREETFGALTFENDEKTIKGQTSGFTDKMLDELNTNRKEYIGKIITVTFNDITKSRDNDFYALSHPRFKEIRTDKNETDTLERALESKQMAMLLS